VAGNNTTQPKQGWQVMPMSSLSILLCLWVLFTTLHFFITYEWAQQASVYPWQDSKDYIIVTNFIGPIRRFKENQVH
jgi:hypothetical protein